jgi:hypothetical protein
MSDPEFVAFNAERRRVAKIKMLEISQQHRAKVRTSIKVDDEVQEAGGWFSRATPIGSAPTIR